MHFKLGTVQFFSTNIALSLLDRVRSSLNAVDVGDAWESLRSDTFLFASGEGMGEEGAFRGRGFTVLIKFCVRPGLIDTVRTCFSLCCLDLYLSLKHLQRYILWED